MDAREGAGKKGVFVRDPSSCAVRDGGTLFRDRLEGVVRFGDGLGFDHFPWVNGFGCGTPEGNRLDVVWSRLRSRLEIGEETRKLGMRLVPDDPCRWRHDFFEELPSNAVRHNNPFPSFPAQTAVTKTIMGW